VKNNLPAEAQKVWMNAFNMAHSQGKSESECAQIAWGAVENGWKKDDNGNWVKKSTTRSTTQAEPIQHQAAFIQKSDAQRYTLGVVYEPDTIDAHGEFADAPTIEKACWDFMKLLQGQTTITKTALQLLDMVVKAAQKGGSFTLDVTELMATIEKSGGIGLGYMHSLWSDGIGDIVENYIAPVDMVINGEPIKKGTWLMGVVWSPEYYEKIQKGEITGYSLGGVAFKVPVQGGEGSANTTGQSTS